MKSNQLILLAGLSLSSFLFSCDKEDVLPGVPDNPSTGTPPPTSETPSNPNNPGTTPPPVSTNGLLTEMGGRQFKYDAQNRLVKVTYPHQSSLNYTIDYEGDKPVRINKDTGGWMTYTYNGDKVSEIVSYYGENLVNYRYTFEYSGDLLVKKTTMSYAQHAGGRLGVDEYQYDANGNMTKYSTRWSTSNKHEDLANPSYITWGNYDSKPNPMPFIEGGFYLPNVKWSANNPGYRDPGNGKELYTYTYLAKGVPSQRSTKLEAYPWVQAVVEKYSYQ